ncbi:ribonuclease H-like domain-containing protein [bacterium]|nr:ribonuclease H-like domain-containing protein [bacterium]
MDLRSRLARLDRLTRRPGEAGDPAPRPQPAAPDATGADVPAELGLSREETAAGPVWHRDSRDPLPPPPDPLPGLRGLFTRHARLGPRVGEILLLDTETTGLMGGTGTLVFLVGLSWWEGSELRTRQYFLPGPGHEAALLAAVAERCREFRAVVTYNGASFDLPLLRTRCLLNRVPDPLAHLADWDLLVPARRLWGRRLADCRQQSLETWLTGAARRGGDIDGARIPQAWFDFLQTGEPGLLGNVLTHNRRDMLGMGRILAAVGEIGVWLGDERAEPPAAWTDRPGAWALGRVRERRRETRGAADCFGVAWAAGWGGLEDPVARRRFRRDAIRNLKRRRRWDVVEQIITDGLDCEPGDRELHREAAILYEHRLGDLPRARRHAERCGDTHRLARLERRLAAGREGRSAHEDDA